ncbi:MAG: energy transducer TonB [Burkholderiales bacterium]|nr:MAG: energy transducer TonB [Burkholderiales bacterium]
MQPPHLDYPIAARRAREEGRVHVRVLVDASGLPAQTLVVQSSGHPRLDASALAAAQSTRFRPHTENGVALPFWVVMPLIFELEN